MDAAEDYTLRKMEQLAQIIEENLPGEFEPGELAFILLVFRFDKLGSGSSANYYATCRREDAIVAVKEFLQHLTDETQAIPT